MRKKEVILLGFVFSLVLFSVLASATDVAYIYRKEFKIDENILNFFDDVDF